MSRIIIGIHGLGNKPSAHLLDSWWRKSIHEGLGRIGKPHPFLKFELVYWAQYIYPKPLDYNLTDPEDPLFIPDPYLPATDHPEKKVPGLRKRLVDYLEKQIDKIFLSDDHVIDVSGITDMIIDHFFKDLHVYFTTEYAKGKVKPGKARKAIQKSLLKTLEKHKGKKILLLAHSMGSIIAFDVIANPDPDIRIDTFITVGSPLGIPAIKQKLLVERTGIKKLQTPETVSRKWYNFSDLEDRVAFDYDLSDDFLPNSAGIQSVNQEIYNDYFLNGERNPHKSYGYLRADPVAGAIAEFLDHGHSRPVQWIRHTFNKLYAQFRRNA
jgi:hypothetical protein